VIKHTVKNVQQVLLDKKSAAEAAAKGMSNTEKIIRKQRDDYMKTSQDIIRTKIVRMHTCIAELKRTALRPEPFDADDHFQLMINTENQAQEPGYKARVEAIHTIRAREKLLRKVHEGKGESKVADMDKHLIQIN
jgi:hypothetical protein